jgi:hypothetical protein
LSFLERFCPTLNTWKVLSKELVMCTNMWFHLEDICPCSNANSYTWRSQKPLAQHLVPTFLLSYKLVTKKEMIWKNLQFVELLGWMSHLANFVKFALDCFSNMLTCWNLVVVNQYVSKGFPQVAMAKKMALFSIYMATCGKCNHMMQQQYSCMHTWTHKLDNLWQALIVDILREQ